MSKHLQYIVTILLLPALLETIDFEAFQVSISGLPLTLGRTCFIAAGLVGLFTKGGGTLNTITFKALGIILCGCILGTLTASGDTNAITRTIAMILLLLGAAGLAQLWEHAFFQYLITIFFSVNFLYWTVYIFRAVLFSGGGAYSAMFSEGATINHHIPGLAISVSAMFVAVNLFYVHGKLKLLGFVVMIIAIVACVLAESRSNFIFTTLGLLLLILKGRKDIGRLALVIVPSVVLLFFIVSYFFRSSEVLSQRFDINDKDYQERTTGMRVDFIYEAFNVFGDNILGRGITDAEVVYKGRTMMIHNQYLTFLLAGGIIALVGIVMWLGNMIREFAGIFITKSYAALHNYLLAIFFSVFIFFISLFTIDSTGLLFFMIISLSCMLDYHLKKVKQPAAGRIPAHNDQPTAAG